MAPRLPAQTGRRWGFWVGVCLLGLNLLTAQTIGLVHGVVHSPAADRELQGLSAGRSARQAGHEHHAHHHHSGDHDVVDHAGDVVDGRGISLESLFSSHEDDSDCRLFDQASHGSAAPALSAVALPALLASLFVEISCSEALARWAALFNARGPPLTN